MIRIYDLARLSMLECLDIFDHAILFEHEWDAGAAIGERLC
jgi:hypothetical protein